MFSILTYNLVTSLRIHSRLILTVCLILNRLITYILTQSYASSKSSYTIKPKCPRNWQHHTLPNALLVIRNKASRTEC
jgi:hypothetical protein